MVQASAQRRLTRLAQTVQVTVACLIVVGWLSVLGSCRSADPGIRTAGFETQRRLDEFRMADPFSFVGIGVGTAESDSLAAGDARLWALGDLRKSIQTGIRETIEIIRTTTKSPQMQKDVEFIMQNLTEATSGYFPPRVAPRQFARWTDEAGMHHVAMVVTIKKLDYMRYYFSLLPLESVEEIVSRLDRLFAK